MREEAQGLRKEVAEHGAVRTEQEEQNDRAMRRIKRLVNSLHTVTQERDVLQRELQEATDLLVGRRAAVASVAAGSHLLSRETGGDRRAGPGAAAQVGNESYADSSMTGGKSLSNISMRGRRAVE